MCETFILVLLLPVKRSWAVADAGSRQQAREVETHLKSMQLMCETLACSDDSNEQVSHSLFDRDAH